MNKVRKIPLTLSLVVINALVFAMVRFAADGAAGAAWSIALLRYGAQFNPLALDGEPYRVITYMFLHGGIVHLLVNMYLLLYAGFVMEPRVGAKKLAFVYFVSGVAGALSGLYWNLFTIGIGASAAIMGLLGFSLVYRIFLPGKSGGPMAVLLLHIALFAAANIFFPQWTYPDYAAQFGGVMAGILIGFTSFANGKRTVARVKFEYLVIGALIALFLLMPRSQVRYFRFFRQMVAAEDTTKYLLKKKLMDSDMRAFIRSHDHWDDILKRLDSQEGLPAALQGDTFRLRRYIRLRKQENFFKKLVVQRESYTYLDSVEYLEKVMQQYTHLDYPLWSSVRMQAATRDSLPGRIVKVLYDSNGVETTGAAAWYRLGVRDSLGRWDGPVRDYYADGRLKMKGTYEKNIRNGVFLYYSANGKHTEAGRYVDGKRFGKWQTFYPNGKLYSEVFYKEGRFVHSVWDSTGNRMVVDGNGRFIQRYANGVVATEGEYHYGKKEGRWYGRYANGALRFEEVFSDGHLLHGKARSPEGKTFVYDETSLYPMPDGGFERYREYMKSKRKEVDPDELGHVKLAFGVSAQGVLNNILIEQGATPMLNAKAKEILVQGPRWLPAREHGYKPVDAEASLLIEFY